MHHLSNMLDAYIEDKESLNCRIYLLYLKRLLDDLSVTDVIWQEDVSSVCSTFECLLRKLDIPGKYGFQEINKELLFKLTMDEYRSGIYESACDFLYYKDYVREAIEFPYKIIYSPVTDRYTINDMTEEESETFAADYLARHF